MTQAPVAGDAQGILAGAAAVDITPRVGAPLAGYRARANVSDDCHDRLEATAFVFAAPDAAVVIVSVDLLAVDADFVREARATAAARIGLDADSIMIAATHTHSGPAAARIAGTGPDEEARGIAMRGVILAIEQAWNARVPGRLRAGRASVANVGLNRHDPKQPPSSDLVAVSVEAQDRQLGVLYAYSCHPTVLDHANLSISADFPGVVRRRIRDKRSSFPVGYLNGAAGDISTRFSRRASTFGELQRLGGLVADGVVAAISSAEPLAVSPIASTRRTLTLATKVGKPEGEAARELASAEATVTAMRQRGASEPEVRRAIVDVEGILEDLARRQHYPPRVSTEVQGLRIGDLVLVSAPGELFSGTGRRISSMRHRTTVLVAGYANDYVGYMPDRAAYERQCYEVSIAQVDEWAAGQIELEARATLVALTD